MSSDTLKKFGVRHIQVALMVSLLFLANAYRVSMSLGIVAMTNPDTTHVEVFDWKEGTRSIILSSFFWGYAATHVPAGALCQRFGPKQILLWGFLLVSILSILTYPLALLGNWQLTVAGRVLQGMAQGFIFPGCHVLLSKWAPLAERAKLSAIVYSAAQLGNVVMLLVGGEIAESSVGWPGIFYFSGIFGIVWCVAWYFFASNSPEECPRISQEEKEAIQESLGQITNVEDLKSVPIPWKSILTSRPFWALVFAQCAMNFGFYTLLTQIPSYLAYFMQFDIKTNALLSAMPYFLMYISCVCCGFLSDYLLSKKVWSVGTSRKFFNSVSLYTAMLALIGLGYMSQEQPIGAMALLCLAVGIQGGVYVGYMVNHIDLSPVQAGVLMGIGNFLGSLNSIVGPLIVGWIVTDTSDIALWRIIFFLTAGYYLLGNTAFVIFGKGTVQPWNYSAVNPAVSVESAKKREAEDN